MSDEWRYEIKYGPDGEANYAWVYDPAGNMVCTAKMHHAIAIVSALHTAAASAEPVAEIIHENIPEYSGNPFATHPAPDAILALRQEPATVRATAASAEPKWWLIQHGGADMITSCKKTAAIYEGPNADVTPLYTHPAPDAEIVAALEEAASYLDRLEEQMLAADADQLVDEKLPPSVIADRLRAALTKAKGARSQ